MRIVLALEQPSFGAAETYALSLANGLSRKNHSVLVMVCPEIQEVVKDSLEEQVKVRGTESSKPTLAVRSWQLFRNLRPQCVHVNQSASAILVAARLARVPVRLITDHVLPAMPTYNLLGTLLEKATAYSSNGVIVFSRQNLEVAGLVWGRVQPHLIYPGVQEPACHETPQLTRKRLGLDGKFVVSTVGRLSFEKDHETFIRAIALAKEKEPSINAMVVGDGPERENLLTLARDLRVTDQISFVGHRNDVGCLLRASDLYIHSSSREGFGFALAEAMAAGLPVVASEIPALKEVVGSSYRRIFALGDYKQLASHILELLRRHEEAQQVGLSLKQRWHEKFTVEKMILAHETLYRQTSGSFRFF